MPVPVNSFYCVRLCLANSLLKMRKKRRRLVLKRKEGRWKRCGKGQCPVLYVFGWTYLVFLGYPLNTTLQQECTPTSCHPENGFIFVSLMETTVEVCFVHISTSALDLTSCFYPEKHCCAIDYALHTVDSATALLNSPRNFLLGKTRPSSIFTHYITYTFFSPDFRSLSRLIDTFPH